MKLRVVSSVVTALFGLVAFSLCVQNARAADCQTALKPTDDYKVLSSTLRCMADQMAAMRKEIDALNGAPSSAPGIGSLPARASPSARVSSGIYQIDLLGCARRGSTITCDLVVMSLGKDGNFYFHPDGTAAFDNLGREFRVARVFFLGKNVGHQPQSTIADVPITGRIEFDGVDATSAAVAALRLNLQGNGPGDRISFRNIVLNAERG